MIQQLLSRLRKKNPSTPWMVIFLGSLGVSFFIALGPAIAHAGQLIGTSSSKTLSKKKESLRNRRVSSANKSKPQNRVLAQNDLDGDLGNELYGEDAGVESDFEDDLEVDLNSSSAGGGQPEASTEPSDYKMKATQKVSTPTPDLGEEVQIADIQYNSKENGGTVLVTTTGPASYRTREIPNQNQVVIEIANAKLPDKLKRPFNTKDFKQATVSITAYQEVGSNTARIVLQYRQPRAVQVVQNDKVLSIVAGATGGSSSSRKKAVTTQSTRLKDDFDSEGAVETEGVGSDDYAEDNTDLDTEQPRREDAALHSSEAEVQTFGKNSLVDDLYGTGKFYGRKISIEVQDTSVRDVITLIADQSGANIIMSDDVDGKVTVKLRQVPWDQALAIIMKTRSLGYMRQGGVIRVAPLRQLQSEAEDAKRIIEAQEATLPLQVKVIPISFTNVSVLAGQIQKTLQAGNPGSTAPIRGRIDSDERTSSIIVTDTADNVRRIEQLVKALDTPPLQVMIEGKIVEAKEDMSKNFGINWGYTGKDIPMAGLTLSHSGAVKPTLPQDMVGFNFRLGTLDFLGDLDAKLRLYERQSMAKIISSPRVVTMNSKEATINQELQIPIATQAAAGQGTAPTTQTLVSTEFKPITTQLVVKPQITSGGDIIMDVKFKREYLGAADGAQAPIEARNVKTNVMVKNGQTAVLGGVYQSDTTETEMGMPYLRHIPILGWLFKSTQKVDVRNELLVFITPRILNANKTLPKKKSIQ